MSTSSTHLTFPMPETSADAIVAEQAEQLAAALAGFQELLEREGAVAAGARLLRDIVTIVSFCDLARLSASAGARLADLAEASRDVFRRETSISPDDVDVGIDAAIALARLIGRTWSELDAVGRSLITTWAMRSRILANAAEIVVLRGHLRDGGHFEPSAPAGAVLH